MMLAYCCRQYGTPETLTLEEVPIPQLGERDILVKVVASTVSSGDARLRAANFPRGLDWIARLAMGMTSPRQVVLGSEAAGIVYRVGAAVGEFRIGDEVVLMDGVGMGCHATFKRMSADGPVVLKPADIDFGTAATLSFGGMTAIHFLERANVKSGQTVLVIGASGCVGSATVQLATHMGALVTGVCREANAQVVKSLGAKRVIDYQHTALRAIQDRFDVVFDTVGVVTIEDAKLLLKPKGKAILAVADLGTMLRAPFAKYVWGIEVLCGPASERKEWLQRLIMLMQKGLYHPLIETRFPFQKLIEAHRLVDIGHKRGSAVVLHYPQPTATISQ